MSPREILTPPTIAFLLLLNACSIFAITPPPDAPTGPVAGSTPRATLDRVKVSTDLSAIRAGIKMYKNDHDGQNAPDMGSLDVSGLYYADAYSYDASAGTVSCSEFPGL